MKKAILATKIGMTQIFNADGVLVPVTVLEAGPCVVTQIKTVENDGYSAVQVGFGDKKEKVVEKDANGKKSVAHRHGVNKAQMGHFKKAGVSGKRFVREFKFENADEYNLADRWKDYEVIDCSCGEKLERWSKYILLRPDPQVIWDTPKTNKNWKKLNGHYHRSKKGGGEWEFFDLPQEWTINYSLPINKELTFHLKPFSFKHTGLFPEQAANWDWFSKKIYDAKKSGRDVKVLNLFAYTGGATLAAAAAGAAVTHVDASKGMVTWAKENAVSSGLGDAPIRWLVDDCVKFVEREIRRGNHYDAIIMDPPSYGRGPKGEIWKIEESVYPLVQLCAKLLTDKPLFFLINSYTTGLQPAVLTYMISTALKKFDGKVTASEIGLPVSSNGLVLPCGASGRFESI